MNLAPYTPAPLTDTDMARIYRRVTGGNRFVDPSTLELMREVEKAAIEALLAKDDA